MRETAEIIVNLQQSFVAGVQLPDREDRRVFWNKPDKREVNTQAGWH